MKSNRRAAIIAAVSFCAAALAAATPGRAIEAKEASLSSINPLGLQNVPTMAEAIAELAQANPAEETAQIVPAVVQNEISAEPAVLETEEEFASLSDAVAAQDADGLDDELRCLAAGVYYEAKGEPLEGQLAVADVILNRTTSGRFPKSTCSVLTQRGQFSFVRGGTVPQPDVNSAKWKTAVAVAKVAREDRWESAMPKALYFHARHVSPRWRMTRLGSVGNHVFYR